MTQRLITSIVEAFKRDRTDDEIHFHARTGRAVPCYDRGCRNPRLDAG
jgi:hypothetical protein